MTTTGWWGQLDPGDRFAVSSRSGNRYEVTFVGSGLTPEITGFYVRMANRQLARLTLNRLDTGSFSRLGSDGAVLAAGDEILLKPKAGDTVRGRVIENAGARLTLETLDAPLSLLLGEIRPGSLRLVFRSGDLLVGDELLVKSRTGSEYRGVALSVTQRSIKIATQTGERLSLTVDRLDLYSLVVLIPLDLTESLCGRQLHRAS